ncbi:DUF3237 domain-containing protein [Paraburkholderia caledonica]|uniref:UPF0311 protein J2776_002828 n=1 Tax=Paraburkholderia caledonica TaxID=134536 RepID=A0ABU1KYS9_9BURK|nr:DUF3237 domain-containing protein [Paraburkholderia caledonica]MDR6376128.1 hypothetical protein [Paraburkholderia caledonica]
MSELKSERLFGMQVRINAPLDVGATPEGHRMVVVIAGGEFNGPKIEGTIVPGSGGDWARIRADGSLSIDARLCLKTADGHLVYMTHIGRFVAASPSEMMKILDSTRTASINPSSYYCRTTALFETASSKYHWLNGIVGVGAGTFENGGVSYDIHAVL